MDSQMTQQENEYLKKENEFLRNIFDSIKSQIYAVDENGIIILYNKYLEQAEKMKRSDVLGRKESYIYLHMDIYKKFNNIIKDTGKPLINVQCPIYKQNGEQKESGIYNSYPFFYNGKYSGHYVIGYDSSLLNQLKDNVMQMQNILLSNSHLSRKTDGLLCSLDDIVGDSPQMKECCVSARKIAMHASAVMIMGETGTGKELFAQGIHMVSPYRNGGFIPINCAAIPDNLLESILFGTTRGAFTGATDSPGLFELANKGTLFLDEINSLPYPFQAKLLRVIQEKRVRRIGDKKEIPINCLIISASNIDLSILDNESQFRSDLFFRLANTILELPPLRERKGDITLLAQHYIKQYNIIYGKHIVGLSRDLERIFNAYTWEGNVRELDNYIYSAMNFVEDDDEELQLHHIPRYFYKKLLECIKKRGLMVDLPLCVQNKMKFKKDQEHMYNIENNSLSNMLEDFELQVILNALKRNKWHITNTAKELGIQRPNLHAKIKKYNIKNYRYIKVTSDCNNVNRRTI